MPATISLEEGNTYVNRIRRVIAEVPEVERVVSQHGRPDDGTDAAGFFNGEFFAPLKPAEQWREGMTKDAMTGALLERLRTEFPGVEFNLSQYLHDNVAEAVSGIKGENSFKVFGPDLQKLTDLARQVEAVLKRVPGVTDLGVFTSLGQPTVHINVDRVRAARYGLTPGDINTTVRTAVGADAAGELQHVGELQALLAGGVVPTVQVGHALLTEALLVFGAIEIGIDLGVVAVLLQQGEVVQHLRLVLGSAAQQVLEVELDEAVGVGALEELLAVEAALGHLAHKLTHAQVTALEQRLRTFEPLAGHHVLVAEHLQIHGADQGRLVIRRAGDPVFVDTGVGVTLDAQVGSVGKGHGTWGGLRRGVPAEGRRAAWGNQRKLVPEPDPMGPVCAACGPFRNVTKISPGGRFQGR